MTDENKKPQVAPEVPEVSEDELSEANGGSFSTEKLYKYVHRPCGGGIEPNAFLGVAEFWWCSRCFETHCDLEDFDYYSPIYKQPMF